MSSCKTRRSAGEIALGIHDEPILNGARRGVVRQRMALRMIFRRVASLDRQLDRSRKLFTSLDDVSGQSRRARGAARKRIVGAPRSSMPDVHDGAALIATDLVDPCARDYRATLQGDPLLSAETTDVRRSPWRWVALLEGQGFRTRTAETWLSP